MTACAAFAPLYYRAMQQALTEIAIANSSVLDTSVHLAQTPGDGFYDTLPVQPPEEIAANLPKQYRSDFLPPVLGYTANSAVLPQRVTDPAGDLIWRSGQC